MGKTALQAQKTRKRFCWFKLLVVCMLLFVLLKLGQQYQRFQYIQADVQVYQQKLEAAQSEYDGLKRQVSLLYHDSYLEQMARSSLGMVKEGEVVVSPAQISVMPQFNDKVNEKDVLH